MRATVVVFIIVVSVMSTAVAVLGVAVVVAGTAVEDFRIFPPGCWAVGLVWQNAKDAPSGPPR